eukprot:TRINITY_DN3320_c0_g1_i1.p1 TRINITY_DN3320_c0_g1~~TRINITY_DN3320_c0_g1_i1.p1  ORF type:complete len:144 (+),score=30.52 TRINITY_DN3320_c0_g1_i1:134-565(+)
MASPSAHAAVLLSTICLCIPGSDARRRRRYGGGAYYARGGGRSLSRGGMIGLIIAAVAVAAVLALIVCFVMKRRQRMLQQKSKQHPHAQAVGGTTARRSNLPMNARFKRAMPQARAEPQQQRPPDLQHLGGANNEHIPVAVQV